MVLTSGEICMLLRKKRGLTQRALGLACGFSEKGAQAKIKRIENGNPNDLEKHLLAKALNVDVECFENQIDLSKPNIDGAVVEPTVLKVFPWLIERLLLWNPLVRRIAENPNDSVEYIELLIKNIHEAVNELTSEKILMDAKRHFKVKRSL